MLGCRKSIRNGISDCGVDTDPSLALSHSLNLQNSHSATSLAALDTVSPTLYMGGSVLEPQHKMLPKGLLNSREPVLPA